MNTLKAIYAAIVVGGIVFLIGRGIGETYLDFLKDSGGIVMAREVIANRYIAPAMVAIICAVIAYKLFKR